MPYRLSVSISSELFVTPNHTTANIANTSGTGVLSNSPGNLAIKPLNFMKNEGVYLEHHTC